MLGFTKLRSTPPPPFPPGQTQWLQRTDQSPAWDPNNEWKENYKQLSKSSTDSFYQSFSSLFINHLEQVHWRLYMFLRKRRVLWMSALQMSGENRNCLESPLGVGTNPVYNISWASLPAKQPITVGSSSGLTWSRYMIGVILIFQSVCQKNTFTWCLHHVCVTHYGSANQEFVGRQRPQKWTKRVLIAGVPYPLSPISQSLSLSPFLPILSPRLLRRLWHNRAIYTRKNKDAA